MLGKREDEGDEVRGCGNGCWNNFYKTIITINKAAGLQGGGISKRCVKFTHLIVFYSQKLPKFYFLGHFFQPIAQRE